MSGIQEVMSRLVLACYLASVAALLDTYRVISPCPSGVAAMLAGNIAAEDDAHWVAVVPSTSSLQTSMMTQVGAPAAIGRLHMACGLVDRLQSAIPKEQPEAAEVIGLAIDALLLSWMRHIQHTDGTFEGLTASASTFTASLFEARGFAEIEKPDFTMLAQGKPIATHRARLPAACLAYDYRLSSVRRDGGSLLDITHAQAVLDALREQPAPGVEEGPSEATAVSGAGGETGENADEDPWEEMRRRAGF